jgi:uncharacterized protein
MLRVAQRALLLAGLSMVGSAPIAVSSAGAQGTRPGIDSLIPRITPFVTDAAHLLSGDVTAALNAKAREVQQRTGGDIVVLTLPDIGDYPPNEVAMEAGRVWKVGGSGEAGDVHRNLGAVLLVVPRTAAHKGRCFVAPGLGLEGTITDAAAGALCRDATDAFRSGDYAKGITGIVASLDAAITAQVSGAPPPKVKSSKKDVPVGLIIGLGVIALGVVIIILIGMRSSGGGGNGLVWAAMAASGGDRSSNDSSSSDSSSDSTGGGGGFDGGGGGSDF